MRFDAIVFDAVRAAREALDGAITAARNAITAHVTAQITAQAGGTNTHVTNQVALARIKSIQRGVYTTATAGTSVSVSIPIAAVNTARAQLRIVWGECDNQRPDGPAIVMVSPPTLTGTAITFQAPPYANVSISWEVTEWF